MSETTPEEVELGWQLENPDGEVIHVDATDEGEITSVDEHPYDDDDDSDDWDESSDDDED